jgi:putative membrane protein
MLKTAEGLASGMGNLAAGQSKLAQSAQTLNNGQRDAVQGLQVFGAKLQQAAAGAHQLSAASSQMQSGMDKWETGFVHFSAGVHALANGGQQLDHGADQLMNGLIRLNDGTGELSGKLTDAAQKTSGIHANDALSSMFSDPVKLEESQMTHVPNYGSGIAPYFLCLALFVGGIMGANILPLARRPELKITGSTHFVNKLGLFYSIGVIQTAIVDAIVLYGFKLHVTSVPQFLLFTLLVSFTFLTLIHMLVNLFGFIGKFASVTLLILQLATCGGTFPVELMSPVMRAIGQCLPMTYALRGLQQVISLGDAKQMADNAVILLGYMIGAALLGLLANLLQHEKQARAAAAQ